MQTVLQNPATPAYRVNDTDPKLQLLVQNDDASPFDLTGKTAEAVYGRVNDSGVPTEEFTVPVTILSPASG